MAATLKAALFDVDGTLVDTNYLHAVTWWQAFAQAGHDVPMAAIHHVIGMGSDQLLDALLPASRDTAADPGLRTAHTALYATYWSRLKPLPGAAELVRACHQAGLKVVLASSADAQELAVLRAVLHADDAIDGATSAADAGSSKPAPDLVENALSKAHTRPQDAVFVGDTVWDVQACQRASVPCIGLRSGGISAQELFEAGALAVFAGPAELLEATSGQLARAFPAHQGS